MATVTCGSELGPLLIADGFAGRFPYFHRRGRHCIELVMITVFERGGVQVHLGSLPLRPALDTRTAEQDAKSLAKDRLPIGYTRYTPKYRAGIVSDSDRRALPKRIRAIRKLVKVEGKEHWATYERRVATINAYGEVSAAIERVDRKGLHAALSRLKPKDAQALLDMISPKDWATPNAAARYYPLVLELLRWRAPYMLASLITVRAVTVLATGKGDRRVAAAVVDWVKPQVKRVKYLARQLASFADRALPREFSMPIAVFSLVIDAPDLLRPSYGNALYSVLSANNGQPVNVARHRRFLRAALKAAGDDPVVRVNAACVWS